MSGPAASTFRRAKAWNPVVAGVTRALNRVTSFVPPPPASSVSESDRVLLVVVHPYGKQPSYTLALGDAVCDSLVASGARDEFYSVEIESLVDFVSYDALIGPVLL